MLDDSQPTAQPVQTTQPSEETAVIGYTEEVVLGDERVEVDHREVRHRCDADEHRHGARRRHRRRSDQIDHTDPIREFEDREESSVVDVVVGVGGNQHTVTASVEDRSHMDYPVLLGRDILENYQVDVSRRIDGNPADTPEEEE